MVNSPILGLPNQLSASSFDLEFYISDFSFTQGWHVMTCIPQLPHEYMQVTNKWFAGDIWPDHMSHMTNWEENVSVGFFCGCFLKNGGFSPQIIHLFIGFSINYKPSILGAHPYFRKHPYLCLGPISLQPCRQCQMHQEWCHRLATSAAWSDSGNGPCRGVVSGMEKWGPISWWLNFFKKILKSWCKGPINWLLSIGLTFILGLTLLPVW